MPILQRIYLDTSVLSALVDERAPDRRELTRLFWSKRRAFTLITSDVAVTEIEGTNDTVRRDAMLPGLREVHVEAVTESMRALAWRYIGLGIFTSNMEADAIHVAAATELRCDVLVSWNFRHLVNRNRRLAVQAANAAAGYRSPDIIAPPEV